MFRSSCPLSPFWLHYPDCLLQLSCPSYPVRLSCPGPDVLPRLSRPSGPTPAILSPALTCPFCPVLAVLSLLSCPGRHIMAFLFSLSVQCDLFGRPIQTDLSKLSFPLSHLLSCPKCPVLIVLTWKFCCSCLVLVVMVQLSLPCVHVLAVLYCLCHGLCGHVVIILSYLFCPGCPVLDGLSQLSYTGRPVLSVYGCP